MTVVYIHNFKIKLKSYKLFNFKVAIIFVSLYYKYIAFEV